MCTACNVQVSTADEFAESLIGTMNSAAMAMMISVGIRSGLFETMKGMKPAASGEIAQAAGLNERYVREWLGAMTAGGIVLCDPDGPRYRLPASHAACLTAEGEMGSFTAAMQLLPSMATVEDGIVECFRKGGGLSYDHFPRFHEVMAEDSRYTVVEALDEYLLPLIPNGIVNLEKGIRVLDIGCGRGRAMIWMAERFPKSSFVGYDLSAEATSWANALASELDLDNVRFEQRDLSSFDTDAEAGAFDLVTAFDAIHDQARPDRVLAGIHKALKPEGVFFMQDLYTSSHHHENVGHPVAPFIYAVSCFHCMTVSLAQGGMGLGAAWGWQKAVEMLSEAGFTSVDRRHLEHDFQNIYYVCGKARS